MLEDYIFLLNLRLIELKELDYLSASPEVGLIALGLSDNSMGSIRFVNELAAEMFDYSRKELLRKRIYDLMPKLFAAHYDSYLSAFSRHHSKKINKDFRTLVGKNKYGYIFPLGLQLQKACSLMSEELVFIANIQKANKKANNCNHQQRWID